MKKLKLIIIISISFVSSTIFSYYYAVTIYTPNGTAITAYESTDEENGYYFGSPEWDIPATTEAIFADVESDADLWEMMKGKEDWEVEETLIWVALDYLGMHEPVYKKEESNV